MQYLFILKAFCFNIRKVDAICKSSVLKELHSGAAVPSNASTGCRHLRILSWTHCNMKFIWDNIKCYELRVHIFLNSYPSMYRSVNIWINTWNTWTSMNFHSGDLRFAISSQWYQQRETFLFGTLKYNVYLYLESQKMLYH